MEPVTHALASITLSRAGLNRATRMATPMLLVSGLAGDLDWFSRFGGARVFLAAHRTATDSVAGVIAIGIVVAAIFWAVCRRTPRFQVGFFPAAAVCAAGAASHVLLDLLNSYGVKLLWPFSSRWFALDLDATIDPWLLIILLMGLLLPELFRLVTQEIGAKTKAHPGMRGAIIALVIAAMYLGGRALAHEHAVVLLDSRAYREQTPLTVAAFPQSSSPLFWSGVVGTDSLIAEVEVPLSPGATFDPEAAVVHYKPDPSAALDNARRSDAAREFLQFARIPLATVERIEGGYRVRMRDLRFGRELSERGVVAVIDLNDAGTVLDSRLEFDSGSSR